MQGTSADDKDEQEDKRTWKPMDKRTGEHTNKGTREYEDKRTSATLHPKRAPCKGRVRQKGRWTTKCQLTNQRTRGPYNKRTRRQDNKRGKRIIYRYDMRTRSRTQKTEEQEDKGEDKGNIWHEDKSKRRQITEEQEDKGNIWHDDKRGQEDRGQKKKGTR